MSFFGDLAAAAESLRASRDFVLRAVQRHGGALKASRFREDRSFLLEAAKLGAGSCLQGAAEALRGDRELVLELVCHDAAAYQFALEELRQEKEFALEAAKRNGGVLKFVGSTFQATGMPLGRWWCGL